MSWASIANNQCVSLNNLQDAVNNGVFTLKNTIPVSNKQTTKGEAEFYVNIDPISKATSQLVVKSNLVANTSTTTTTTTVACYRYELCANDGTGDRNPYPYTYVNCVGTPSSGSVVNLDCNEICAALDSVDSTSGAIVITELGTCATTTTTTTIPSSPQYAIAGTGNSIYTSNNNGGNWSVNAWFALVAGVNTEFVEINSTGQYMFVVGKTFTSFLSNVWLSSNFGNSFTYLFSTNASINGIAMSDNGQYLIYVTGGNSGNIGRSSDFGASWSYSSAPIQYSNWKSIAMSSSGQYVTIVSLNSYIWVSSDYGVSYTAKTTHPATNWGAVTMSSNGQYQVAGRDTIYRSTNYGSTWTNVGAPVSNGYGALAMSGDGQYLLGLSYFRNLELYRSTNYGANWSIVTTIGSGGSGNWNCVAISPDGVTQLVGANGNVWPTNDMWRSTNSGANFNIVSGTNEGWNSISIGN